MLFESMTDPVFLGEYSKGNPCCVIIIIKRREHYSEKLPAEALTAEQRKRKTSCFDYCKLQFCKLELIFGFVFGFGALVVSFWIQCFSFVYNSFLLLLNYAKGTLFLVLSDKF
jgi:hypothetical protein